MLVLLVVLLAAAAVCARLGVWQLDRAHVERDAADRSAAAGTTAPVALDDVLAPQTSFRGELVSRAVTASGTYEPEGELLVPGREVDGRAGVLVLTPLRTQATGGSGAAVLPVVRGWVPSADDADALAVPTGPVTVTGYLQPSEASGALDTEAGTAEAISSAQLVNAWGGPIYAGYLVLADATPAPDDALTLLPRPGADDDGGWDLRNLGYAAQWWIFGIFALGLWWRMVRDEARGDPAPDEVAGDEPRGITDRQGADAAP